MTSFLVAVRVDRIALQGYSAFTHDVMPALDAGIQGRKH